MARAGHKRRPGETVPITDMAFFNDAIDTRRPVFAPCGLLKDTREVMVDSAFVTCRRRQVAGALCRLARGLRLAEGGGLPFRSCFRSSSAAVPQQLRSSSAAVPQQLRSSSAAAPQQLRSSSAAAPQQLRSSSAAAPQSFRVTSAVVPCYLRSRSVLPPQSCRVTYLRSSTDETPASPPPSVGYAHGGRLWLRCVHHHGNGRERESRGANPATDA